MLTPEQRDVLTKDEIRLYEYCNRIAQEYSEAQQTCVVLESLATKRIKSEALLKEFKELQKIRNRLVDESEARRKMLKKINDAFDDELLIWHTWNDETRDKTEILAKELELALDALIKEG